MSRIFVSMFTATLFVAGAHGLADNPSSLTNHNSANHFVLHQTQPVGPAKPHTLAQPGSLAGCHRKSASLTDISIPGFWRNEEWIELPLPEGSSHGSAFTVATYAGDIYIGGYCARPKQGYAPGYWKNGTWVALPSPNPSQYGSVTQVTVSGENVYAAGYVSNVQNIAIPALWKNEIWVDLPLPKAMKFGVRATALAATENDVFVSANLYYSDDKSPLQDTGYWKSRQWKALQGPKDANIASVDSLFFHGGDLYAAGSYSTKAGLSNQPCYWKNGQCLTPEICAGSIRAILVNGNAVYAAGDKVNNANERTSGYWKNNVWIPLSHPAGARVTEILSAYLSEENELFLVPKVQSDKVSLPFYWRNGTWISLQPPADSTQQEAFSLCIYNNDVYVAGNCWFPKKP